MKTKSETLNSAFTREVILKSEYHRQYAVSMFPLKVAHLAEAPSTSLRYCTEGADPRLISDVNEYRNRLEKEIRKCFFDQFGVAMIPYIDD